MSTWNLTNTGTLNASQLQGIPVSDEAPMNGEVLQYLASQGQYVPEPITSLPQINAIQNIGTGTGIWASTLLEIANLKSLKAGPNVTITSDSDSITIDSSVTTDTNIYNTDGTLTTDRVMTLGGKKLVFGPQSATSDAQLFLDPASKTIGLYSFNGEVNVGDTDQSGTNIESRAINLVAGATGLLLDSTVINLPQQANGILKTTVGQLSAGASLNDLSDVTITAPTTNNTIVYNGSQWINSAVPSNINDGTISTTTTWSSSKINSTFEVFAGQWFSGSVGGLNTTAARTNDFLTINANVYDLEIWMYNDFANNRMSKKWTLIGAGNITGGVYWGLKESYRHTTASAANDVVLEFSTTGSVLTLRARLIGTDILVTQTPQYRIFNRATGVFTTQFSFGSSTTPATIFYDQGVNNVLLNRLQDVNITAPTNNQILRYDTAAGQWLNSSPVFSSNLIFSGRILAGSTLVSIFDYVTIMDITYTANASVNLTITMSAQDANDASMMVWDVGSFSGQSLGNWLYIQPRTQNNWSFYNYALYIRTDPTNSNKFAIAFQKLNSSSTPSTNTAGYFFNIYSFSNPVSYTFNVFTNPSFLTATGYLSSGALVLANRRLVNVYSGTNLTAASLGFTYQANYSIQIKFWTELRVNGVSSGTLNCRLNGVTLVSVPYNNPNVFAQVIPIVHVGFGNALQYLNAGVLLPLVNTITFTITNTAGTSVTTGCGYNVNVTLQVGA